MISLEQAASTIEEWCKLHEQEMVSFLREFVAMRSVTYEEGEVVTFLLAHMREFDFDEVRCDPVGNVFGRVGTGPTVMLYDAHVDSVDPGDPAAWGFDPLQGKLENGIIYGRGVVDDKGALAAMIFAGWAIKELGLDTHVSMWVSGSVAEEDEEGCCLTEGLRLNDDIKPDCVVVAESSELQVMRGQIGYKPEHIVNLGRGAVLAAKIHHANKGDTQNAHAILVHGKRNLKAALGKRPPQ